MSLYGTILKKKQETNAITHNWVLCQFDSEACKEIERLSLSDKFIKKQRNSIIKLLKQTGIDYNDKQKQAFEEYNEAKTYLDLKKKFIIIPIPKKPSVKTPDFKISYKARDFHIEMKTLSMLEGSLNHIEVQKRGMDAKIEIERQLKAGKNFASAETVISPYQKGNSRDDSTLHIVNSIIEKIDQNIKLGQVEYENGVLLVDMKQLGIIGKIKSSIMPVYSSRDNNIISGCLWHVAFGNIGNRIYKPIEFEGKSNIDGILQKEGILIKYPTLKMLAFQVYEGNQSKIVVLHRYEDFDDIQGFIYKFSFAYNDNKNTNAYHLN